MSKQHVENGAEQGTTTSYITGFILSVLFTLFAYQFVVNGVMHGWALIASLAVLAVAQLLVQLVFFLHLGKGSKPRWNLIVFCFMLLIVVIIVVGSIWIMAHLNYNMATPTQTDTKIIRDEGIKP